jgi:sporulation protein YlmC with PRC-barrel domain
MRALKVSALEDMAVYNGRGEKLGEVEKIMMGADNKPYFLISHGGFLGLGSKQVAISSDQLALRGDQLIAAALTDEQVRGFPEFKESSNFKEMDDDQTTSVRAEP